MDEYGRVTSERKVAPEEWYDIYLERIESKQKIRTKKKPLPKLDFRIPNTFKQFWIFTQRDVLSKLANRQFMLLYFLQAPLLALVMAWFTRYTSESSATGVYVFGDNENLPPFMFMGIIVSLFNGLMVSAQEIIKDRTIIERESFLNLSRLSYLHSKILVLFFISAIQTLTFVMVGNAVLEIKGMLFHFWAIFFTMSCVANLIGLNVSSGVNSVVTANSVIPFIVVPQLLFSGVMIPFDRLNNLFENPAVVPVIGELMPSRWAYEAIAVQQFKGNKFTREFFEIEQDRHNAIFESDLIREVEVILDDVYYTYDTTGGNIPESSEESFALIRNELKDLSSLGVVASFGKLEDFSRTGFSEALYLTATDSLEKASDRFKYLRNQAELREKALDSILIGQWGGAESYNEMKRRHTNKRLEEMLLNKGQFLVKWNQSFIRKAAPIYHLPKSKTARSHLFAPVKRVGPFYIDTYWFNLFIIWFSGLQLYITLQFDLLRRFTNWNQIRKLRKRS
ncbi:MAG: ABC transporter permease [Bacteroidia bacterium]|nr:MAG: ABC transporter permease [Bacteroidia bacterium]